MWIRAGTSDGVMKTQYINGSKDRNGVNQLQKVKQSRNRPGVAQRVPGGLDS
jgi:hypothetical protein